MPMQPIESHRCFHVSFLLWIVFLFLVSTVTSTATAQPRPGTQPRRTSPDGVKLISEKAPQGKECGRWIQLEYQACKQVRVCRGAQSIRTEDVNDLADQLDQAIDRRIERTCRALGCPTARRSNEKNSFDCAGPRRLCMKRSLSYTCSPRRASPDPSRRTVPPDSPRRTSPSPTRTDPPRRVPPERPRQERPQREQARQEQPRRVTPESEPEEPVQVHLIPEALTEVGGGDDGGGDGGGGGGRNTVPDGLDLTSNVIDCVDPRVDSPPAFTATPPEPSSGRSGIELSPAARRSGQLRFDGSARRTEGAAARGARSIASPGGFAARSSPTAASSCQQDGLDLFLGGGVVESIMPPVNFPEVACEGRCRAASHAWAQAHHHVWRARQVIHLIASAEHSAQRSYLWRQPGLGPDDQKLGRSTSPEYWFGPFSEERLETVKDGFDKLWEIFTSNKTGGIKVRLKCPDPHTEPGNVCYTTEPSAHHWVKGYVNLCSGFFSTGGVGFAGSNSDVCNGNCNRARLVAHELMHHLFVRQGSIWVAVQDTHYHGHGLGCGLHPGSEAHYGEGKIRHLATYRNSNGSTCGHLKRNVRNNDTYAWFAMAIGERIYDGRMVAWPAPATPTPVPPQDCDQGTEGCQCDDESTHPLNTYFEPDGDADDESWCPDNDGEMTCVKKAFGTGNNVGICTKCEEERGPGCECDYQQPCQVGSCFGDDTFNGGVGRCWKEPPPAWACLADCERLYNDPGAYCYYDYPAQRGRCMDSSCPRPTAFACAEQGKVCRYGECIVECTSNADCEELGYPEYFECSSASRCEYAFD